MASVVIHMCVANEINKVLKRNNDLLLIGSMAPDISKQIGESKDKSHFLDNNLEENVPNLDLFLNKYQKNLNDDFVLGYYIHLYTDYIWFKLFIPDFIKKNVIYKLDGTIENISGDIICEYIYNDYTNLNKCLLDKYNMNLNIFNMDIPPLNNIITEIPMNKIKIIIDKTYEIIENSKLTKNYLFDVTHIEKFINFSVNMILDNLAYLELLKKTTQQ